MIYIRSARARMKMMGKYHLDPKIIKEVVPLIVDDFELSKDESITNEPKPTQDGCDNPF